MTTQTIGVFARTAAILVGVVLFALGLVNEESGFFWVGTVLFLIGLAALARATLAESADESESGHG
jgi:hypothetical protein